jgi:hypothetical protein
MSIRRLQLTAIFAWLVLLAVVAGVGRLVGVPATPGFTLLFLAAAVLPPAILLVVFRGAPPRTINEVLYEEEQTARAPIGRPAGTPRER